MAVFTALAILIIVLLSLNKTFPVSASALAQIPTLDIATVTSTPSGPIATVMLDQDQINVRSGPGTSYAKIGVLLSGQQVPAKGRSVGSEWILIEYPGVTGGQGWIYAPLVNLTPGNLPIVEPPPTPTPLYTMTIDPTLAAQFIVTAVPTRLPTFTEPPPLTIPTFQERGGLTSITGGMPSGLIILSLAAVGLIIGLFTLAQGR